MDYVLSNVFSSDSYLISTTTLTNFLAWLAMSLILGFCFAFVYAKTTRSTTSYLTTVALTPAIVCVIIMMVNGNVGTGIAVAGAFSLVRFRSAPGSAREIGILFSAMACGLISGMGYLLYAALFTAIICAAYYASIKIVAMSSQNENNTRSCTICLAEDMDFEGVFDEVFAKYCSRYDLEQVKTTNLGSLFKLTYMISLKAGVKEKDLIDDLRCRNGNLEVFVSRNTGVQYEL